jgi:hypothetical protein
VIITGTIWPDPFVTCNWVVVDPLVQAPESAGGAEEVAPQPIPIEASAASKGAA